MKNILGEELYDLIPALITTLFVIAGIIYVIGKTL